MKIVPLTVIAFLLSSMSLYAVAANDHHDHDNNHHQQQLDAHVHGLANMTLAIAGDDLDIELTSPSANIAGFEHEASTPEQTRIVNNAKLSLEAVQGLFSFKGAKCTIETIRVNMDGVLEQNNDHHENHRRDDHWSTEHAKGEHDKHRETHSEITAYYHFNCQQAEKLTSISLKLFESFPGIEKLKARWITRNRQGAAELTAASNTIRFR